MCMLTFIDFKDQDLAKLIIRPLTELNSLSNKDGFGYYLFSESRLIKTKKSASEWWPKNEDKFLESHENINGIYHVRLASTNKLNLKAEDSHPFCDGSLVLAHNGTLGIRSDFEKAYSDIVKSKKIDSEMFLNVLKEFWKSTDDKHDAMKNALNKFYGSFAFLIHDLSSPDKLFIAKGKQKRLHFFVVYEGEEQVGVLLNTGSWELDFISNILIRYGKIYNRDLSVKYYVINDGTMSYYTFGKYDEINLLGQVTETLNDPTSKVIVPPSSRYSRAPYNSFNNLQHATASEKLYAKLERTIYDLGLSFIDAFMIYEHCFQRPITTADDALLNEFLEFLEYLDEKWCYSTKEKEWTAICKDYPERFLYAHKDWISYPYLLNGSIAMENLKEELDNANSTVQ